MAINAVGIVSIGVFYTVILSIGLWAAWRNKQRGVSIEDRQDENERAMVGGRDIGLIVGSFTMTGEINFGVQFILFAMCSSLCLDSLLIDYRTNRNVSKIQISLTLLSSSFE